MTGRVAGVVTLLDAAMHNNCFLIQIWCGVHQLDLVMEDIMSNVIKERFCSVMTGFITHLTRQQNLIAKMQTTCHGLGYLGYFGILLAMSWPRIFWDTFGNIMA